MYKYYVYKEEKLKSDENKPIWRPRRKVKRPYHADDLPACVQYLIVGAGAAGWAAYRSIMANDKTAKVFFITKEDILPYMQPPMSKHMWFNPEPPDIMKLTYLDDNKKRHTMFYADCATFMDPVKFYRKKKGPAVSIATGWCVLRVDADDHVAYVKTMCGEQPIYYERLLLAPGSKPKNLTMFKTATKAVRDRVCLLRTIRDLEISFRKVKESKTVAVIGGGVLGSELAYYLGRMYKITKDPFADEQPEPIKIIHIYKDGGVMGGILPEYLGKWAAEKIRCQGTTLMPNTQVYDAYESKDGRLELTLSNGKNIVTDYAFVSIGGLPREEMANPSELELDEVNGGYLVNTELSARKHLYVAGDAASIYIQWKDQRMRFEHFDNAVQSGTLAGANMTGYWSPCNMEPHFMVHLCDDLQMEVIGEVGACMPTIGLFKECEMEPFYFKEEEREKGADDRICYRKGGEYEARYRHGLVFYLRDNIVVGFLFWNMAAAAGEDRVAIASEMLRSKPTYDEIDIMAELLGFPTASCFYRAAKEKAPEICLTNRKWD